VPSPIASKLSSRAPAARASLRLALATTILLFACQSLQDAVADGDTRTIAMRHLHTRENITVTFKRNGRYDEAALKQLNWFLRDWRHDKETRMDPRLIDLVWEVYREVDGSQPIEIICGYRDESTNSMLRRRSSGVAQNSLHMSGKAMDFAIPGVALDKLRAAGLRLQRGGVGFYPSSGSPFVHMDIGGVRHWPRMTREQLVRVFPDGRTVHVPSDGQPLARYALALGDIERRGGSPGSVSATAARDAGIETETTASVAPRRSLLARIFGSNEPEEAEEAKQHAAPVPVRVAAAPAKTAPVPLPKVRPADAPIVVAMATPAPSPAGNEKTAALSAQSRPQTATLASTSPSPNEIIRARGYWAGLPDMTPVGTTGSGDQRLAYAPVPERHAALGHAMRRTVVMRSAETATSIAVKGGGPATPPVQTFDPWLNAVTITPSVWTYLSSTQYGVRDSRSLRPFLDKPTATVAIAFSTDRHLGLSAERFSGRAVVFVGTVAFAANAADPTKTASLD
jgi:uncharacterized protein YcbK (DUF882 family)